MCMLRLTLLDVMHWCVWLGGADEADTRAAAWSVCGGAASVVSDPVASHQRPGLDGDRRHVHLCTRRYAGVHVCTCVDVCIEYVYVYVCVCVLHVHLRSDRTAWRADEGG